MKYQLVLEEYSPYLDRDLDEVNYFDAGDIPLPFGNPQKSLDEIEDVRDEIISRRKSSSWYGWRAFSVLAGYESSG